MERNIPTTVQFFSTPQDLVIEESVATATKQNLSQRVEEALKRKALEVLSRPIPVVKKREGKQKLQDTDNKQIASE